MAIDFASVASPPVEIIWMTPDEFDVFAVLPENRDRLFELIGGKVVEVASNHKSSNIAARIIGALDAYLLEHDIGYLTGADGGYRVMGDRYIPDVAFISYEKRAEPNDSEGYCPHPPDLAIEVMSPGNDEDDMTIKIANYMAAGAIVWRVRPEDETVAVFMAGQAVKLLQIEDELDGGTVLPGFKVTLKRIFGKK
jgi:Uma2 family endonuclease